MKLVKLLKSRQSADCVEDQQARANHRKTPETWFGTRRSVVRIHSPRPTFSNTYRHFYYVIRVQTGSILDPILTRCRILLVVVAVF